MSSPEAPIKSPSPSSLFQSAPKSPVEPLNNLSRRTAAIAPSILYPTSTEEAGPVIKTKSFSSLDEPSLLEIVKGLLKNDEDIFNFLCSPKSPIVGSVTLNFMYRRSSYPAEIMNDAIRIKFICRFLERNPEQRESICADAKFLVKQYTTKYSNESEYIRWGLHSLEKVIHQAELNAKQEEGKKTEHPGHKRQISETFPNGEPLFDFE